MRGKSYLALAILLIATFALGACAPVATPAPQIVKMVIFSEMLIVISLIVQNALPWTVW